MNSLRTRLGCEDADIGRGGGELHRRGPVAPASRRVLVPDPRAIRQPRAARRGREAVRGRERHFTGVEARHDLEQRRRAKLTTRGLRGLTRIFGSLIRALREIRGRSPQTGAQGRDPQIIFAWFRVISRTKSLPHSTGQSLAERGREFLRDELFRRARQSRPQPPRRKTRGVIFDRDCRAGAPPAAGGNRSGRPTAPAKRRATQPHRSAVRCATFAT